MVLWTVLREDILGCFNWWPEKKEFGGEKRRLFENLLPKKEKMGR